MLSRSLFGNNDDDKCRVISQVTMVTKASILHIDIVRDLLSFEFKFIAIHYFVFPKCIYKTTFFFKVVFYYAFLFTMCFAKWFWTNRDFFGTIVRQVICYFAYCQTFINT